MIPLDGEYYVECNEVFRRATNQSALMLDELVRIVGGRSNIRILSVGCGAGLFEIPMLKMTEDQITAFVGVDINEHACRILRSRLNTEIGVSLIHKVETLPFQEYQTDRRFEIVLFNHSFEYFDGDRLGWINKSQGLLAESGNVLIFSPNQGGINKYYGEFFTPCFSEELSQDLNAAGITHTTASIDAKCDVSLLADSGDDPDRIRLLSFLTQADCRDLPASMQREFANYYLSLQEGETSLIRHPATLFVL